MDVKKIKLKTKDNMTALQRILQIFSRRSYSIESIHVITSNGFKEILLEFPADFYIYRTVVEQLKKMIDIAYIEHDKIDMEKQELVEMENLF